MKCMVLSMCSTKLNYQNIIEIDFEKFLENFFEKCKSLPNLAPAGIELVTLR
jgi:hypothetical protein